MTGRSPYEVVLSEAGLSLSTSRRVTRDRTWRLSGTKLVLMAADGLTSIEIGARLGMSREAVGRWRRRFCEQRLEGLRDRVVDLSQGRPPSRSRGRCSTSTQRRSQG